MPDHLPRTLLDLPVSGYRLDGSTLREVLGTEPTLLVFLRQLGCVFCRETVRELREVSESDPSLPRVVVVHPAEEADGESFFAERWPGVSAVADPSGALFDAAAIVHGTAGQLFGPGALASAVMSAWNGNRQGSLSGDARRMPGAMLVAGERVLWRHDYRHAGDHPRFRSLPAIFRELASSPAAP